MVRYQYLPSAVKQYQCKIIVEIGVLRCKRARRMIEAALTFSSPEYIFYYGFDLFELWNSSVAIKEQSTQAPLSQAKAQTVLTNLTGANITMVKGDSKKTVSKFAAHFGKYADLIFIDGGHSVPTIASDWKSVQPIVGLNTLVFFDDYYINPHGRFKNKGCKTLIDSLSQSAFAVEVLPQCDLFKGDDPNDVTEDHLVKVRKR